MIWQMAWRYMAGRWMRTVLVVMAVALGVMITFGLNSMAPAMLASLRQGIETTAVRLDILLTQQSSGMFPASVADEIGALPIVRETAGVISRPLALPADYAYTSSTGLPVGTVDVNALDLESEMNAVALVLTEGRTLAAGRNLQPGDTLTVVIPETMAEAYRLTVGDDLILPAATGTIALEVVGVYAGEGPAVGSTRVYMPLPAGQAMFNADGLVNGVIGNFTDDVEDFEAAAAAVLAAAGPGFQVGDISGGAEAFESMLELSSTVITLFGVLALLMAGFIMFNTFQTIVVERRRDIGLLRALGATRGTVARLILAESVLEGLVGTALGIVLGVGLGFGATALIGSFWAQFFNAPLGNPVFTLVGWVVAIVLGVGVPVVSGLLPLQAAMRVTPLEALRPTAAGVTWQAAAGRLLAGGGLVALAVLGLLSGNMALSAVGMVLFFAGIVVAGPALVKPVADVFGTLLVLIYAREGRLAQGNSARQPGRAAITASTIAISLAILIALTGLGTSAIDGMLTYLDDSMQADYLLLPEALVLGSSTVGAGPELRERLEALPEVALVTTLRQVTAPGQGPTGELSLQVIGVDPVTYPQIAGLAFIEGSADTAFAAMNEGRSVILNGTAARALGLGVGDTLVMETSHGAVDYTVVGIGLDYLNAKLQTIYISQAAMAEDFNITADLVVMLNTVDGVTPQVIEPKLLAVTADFPAFDVLSYERLKESQIETTQYAKYGINLIVVLLGLPSLLALANTLGINVLERTREIGMLRAVGATRAQVRRMIIAESLLLATMGIAFGILAGLWMGYLMVGALSFVGLPLPYYFPYSGTLVAIAAGLIIAVVAALIPARRAARLDIVRALAYE